MGCAALSAGNSSALLEKGALSSLVSVIMNEGLGGGGNIYRGSGEQKGKEPKK
jgi:hypothetical protein